jgi:hypothetical protein
MAKKSPVAQDDPQAPTVNLDEAISAMNASLEVFKAAEETDEARRADTAKAEVVPWVEKAKALLADIEAFRAGKKEELKRLKELDLDNFAGRVADHIVDPFRVKVREIVFCVSRALNHGVGPSPGEDPLLRSHASGGPPRRSWCVELDFILWACYEILHSNTRLKTRVFDHS